jgi:hypothetical protein
MALLLVAWTLLASMLASCNRCTAVRTAVPNFADLDDHLIFANRTIEPRRGPRSCAPCRVRRASCPKCRFRTRRGATPARSNTLGHPDRGPVVMHEDRIVYERMVAASTKPRF